MCIIKDESAPPDDVMRPSGDRVLVDGAGVVWYRGRADRQVKRHGKRMNLDELEQVNPRHLTLGAHSMLQWIPDFMDGIPDFIENLKTF